MTSGWRQCTHGWLRGCIHCAYEASEEYKAKQIKAFELQRYGEEALKAAAVFTDAAERRLFLESDWEIKHGGKA